MHQSTLNILQGIMIMIKNYNDSNQSLRKTVDDLEGSVNAIEEKLSNKFYSNWQTHWGNLEIILAMGFEKTKGKEISEELSIIEKIIKEELTK